MKRITVIRFGGLRFRLRRIAAFVVDLFFIGAIASIIDNLLFYPIPRIGIGLFRFLLFIAYFLLVQDPRLGRASVGKRIFRLGICDRAGDAPNLRIYTARTALLAFLFSTDWTDLFASPDLQQNYLLPTVVFLAQVGLVFYDIGLAMVDRSGRSLHDRLTKTSVYSLRERDERPALPYGELPGNIRIGFWGPVVSFGAIPLLIGLVFFLVMFKVESGDWEVTSVGFAKKVAATDLEKEVARVTGTRIRIDKEVRSGWAFDDAGNRVPQRSLIIELWHPLVLWNTPSMNGAITVVGHRIRDEIAEYDHVAFSLTTGPSLFRLSKTWQGTPMRESVPAEES